MPDRLRTAFSPAHLGGYLYGFHLSDDPFLVVFLEFGVARYALSS